ncbi:restriction endonuclease subunit S, partial [Lachnobacterium bovis]|uniref:restriction endonuclease subunit S n=1 Tax=Lachnobacterium bovis TaxID=140626 RepID=UPI0003B6AC17
MDKKWVMIPDVLFFQEGPGVRNTQYTNEGVKLLNVANLVDGKVDLSTSDRYISEDEAYGKYSHFLCDEGDFIVASSGIKVEYIDKKMGFIDKSMLPLCMNTSTIRFKVLNPDELRIRYFMYYLKSMHFKGQLFRLITGSAQLNYGPSHLKQMQMPLIDIGEQDKIINRLDRIQRVIEARQQELLKFDEFIKARFVELFGDPIHNEMGWDTAAVESVCKEIFGGGTPSKSHPEYYENGDIPWVSSKDMKTDVLTESQIYINQKGVDNSTARMVPVNSVIMVIRSGILKHTLPVAINAVPITVNQDLKVFIPGESMLTRFMAVQFKMQEADILSGVRAVTADNIEFNSLKQRAMIVPPIELQKEYVDFLKQVDKSKV